MKSLLLAVLLLLPAAPRASAFEFFGEPKAARELSRIYDGGDYAEIVKRLSGDGVLKLPRRARARGYHLLGASYERLGRAKDAIAVYRLAEGLYPKDLGILTALADLLHANDLDDQARPLYQRVLAIHPNNAASNLGMAEICRHQGFTVRAQAHYERALKEWNQAPRIWRGYAETLGQRRDFKAAVSAIRRALELSDDADSLLTLARFQRSAGEVDAYDTLRRALAKAPHRETRLRLALWLLEDERLDEALAETAALLREEPEAPLALWIRASVNLRRGRTADARRDLLSVARTEQRVPFLVRTAKEMLARMGDR
ncbi:MAG: tetratricopeptide repeat protein [Elusimicrobiota bacterium]|jgi:tetratricopeptide (TPR) repeat protein